MNYCKKLIILFIALFSLFGVISAQEDVSECFLMEELGGGKEGWRITGYQCDATSLEIPSKIDGVKVVEIGSGAFKGKLFTSVVFPSSLTSIGDFSFENNALTRLDIPEGVIKIGDSAFKNNQISILKIPETLKALGKEAFNSNKISSIVVKGRLDKVGEGAFCDNAVNPVMGTSETLEWNFSDACFNLERLNSFVEDEEVVEEDLEDYYDFDELFDDGEYVEEILKSLDENKDDEDTLLDDEGDENDGAIYVGIPVKQGVSNTGDDIIQLTSIPLSFSNFGLDNIDLNSLSSQFDGFNFDSIETILTVFGVAFGILAYLPYLFTQMFGIACWEIFRKAGKRPWTSLIPFYNFLEYTDIAGVGKVTGLLFFLPCVLVIVSNYVDIPYFGRIMGGLGIFLFVLSLMIYYSFMRKFGCSRVAAFLLTVLSLTIIIPFIVILVLGLGNARYRGTVNLQNKGKESNKKEVSVPEVVSSPIPQHPEPTIEEIQKMAEDPFTHPDDNLQATQEQNSTTNIDEIISSPSQESHEGSIGGSVEGVNENTVSLENQIEDVSDIHKDQPIEERPVSVPNELDTMNQARPQSDVPISDLDQLMANQNPVNSF